MPNNKLSARDRAFQYKKDGFYCTDKNTVMCKFCNCQVAWERKDTIEKHLKSGKHVSAIQSDKGKRQLQTSIATCFSSVETKKKTADYLGKRVAETFIKANIPLHKLDNEHVKSFMSEFIEGAGNIPCSKVIREKYLPLMQTERETDIKDKLNNKQVAVFCDETTDSREKCVFVILFKIIDSSSKPEIFVGDVHILETADSKTCSRAILDTLKKYDVCLDNVVALVSDSAKYMVKCFDILHNLLSDDVIVVQCWAHKLNLILNMVGKHLPELHTLVSKVKSSFLNSHKRKHLFRSFLDQKYPDKHVPLFPMPVLTRWSSWYDSVTYLQEYVRDIVEFFKSEDVSGMNNTGIDFLHNLSGDDLLAAQAAAAFVADVGSGIVDLIKFLEGHSYPTVHVLSGRLKQIGQVLQLASSGEHCEKTKSIIDLSSNSTVKRKIYTTLNNAASHASTKLSSLMSNDPANSFYKLAAVFDPAEMVHTDVTQELAKKIKKLTFFHELEESTVQRGYIQLQSLVKSKINANERVDIISLLQGMSINYSDFTTSTLKAIWMPCANADCERFFSSYNNVLSDKRHRLSQTNVNLYTEMYFEC